MKTSSVLSPVGLLALFVLAWPWPAAAQAPAWQAAWVVAAATGAAAPAGSVVKATVVDSAGNVYLAGYFKNTVVLGGTTLTSLGGDDVFVAKFSPTTSRFVWAQRAGGTGNDEASALAVSGRNVYVAGSLESPTADFGPATLTSAGGYDGFVAKLTDAGGTGSFTWAQQAGGPRSDGINALAVGGSSVYVAGTFRSPTAGFGALTLANAGVANMFVAKLTDAGSTAGFVWVQRADGTGDDTARALAVSGSSVYVAGNFSSPTLAFGPATLTSAGAADGFVAKLTDAGSTGRFGWAQRAGGPQDDAATALAVTGSSVYVAGDFESPTADFGPTKLTNAGASDMFVAKLTDAGSTGRFAWAYRAGGTANDYAHALAVRDANVYLAGATADLPAATLPPADAFDVFVAKLTDAGSTARFAWTQRAGGTGSEMARALALSGSRVYVAGFFRSPRAAFGPATLTNPNPKQFLAFLATLPDAPLPAPKAAPGPR